MGFLSKDAFKGKLNVNRLIQWKFDYTIQITKQVSPSCKDMLIWCEYGGVAFNCSSKFSAILTDDGLCCNFNGEKCYKFV